MSGTTGNTLANIQDWIGSASPFARGALGGWHTESGGTGEGSGGPTVAAGADPTTGAITFPTIDPSLATGLDLSTPLGQDTLAARMAWGPNALPLDPSFYAAGAPDYSQWFNPVGGGAGAMPPASIDRLTPTAGNPLFTSEASGYLTPTSQTADSLSSAYAKANQQTPWWQMALMSLGAPILAGVGGEFLAPLLAGGGAAGSAAADAAAAGAGTAADLGSTIPSDISLFGATTDALGAGTEGLAGLSGADLAGVGGGGAFGAGAQGLSLGGDLTAFTGGLGATATDFTGAAGGLSGLPTDFGAIAGDLSPLAGDFAGGLGSGLGATTAIGDAALPFADVAGFGGDLTSIAGDAGGALGGAAGGGAAAGVDPTFVIPGAGTDFSGFSDGVNIFSATDGAAESGFADPWAGDLTLGSSPGADLFTPAGGSSGFQDIGAFGDGLSFSNDPAAISAASQASGGGFFDKIKAGWGAIKDVSSGLRDIGPLLSVGGLAATALKGSPNTASTPAGTALTQNAATLASTGTGLVNNLTSGALPPGVEAGLDIASQAAKAQIRTNFANMGLTGSSMEAGELGQVDEKAAAQKFQTASTLAQLGLQMINSSNAVDSELMKEQIAQDSSLQNAIAKFAAALAGGGVRLNLGQA